MVSPSWDVSGNWGYIGMLMDMIGISWFLIHGYCRICASETWILWDI